MNDSGLQPVEYKVLIKPEAIEETDPMLSRAKSAIPGFQLASQVSEREQMAQVKGTLVAVGGNAFEGWHDPMPKVGDTVYYAKYAGLNVPGKDGVEYRLANDKDVSAIVR